jgi:Zn-dependent protease with chaperone function
LNFFEQQDQAKRQSRWLIFLFCLAVVAIVASICVILLLVLGVSSVESEGVVALDRRLITDNLALLSGGAVGSLSVIGLASLSKTLSLRSGGGKVARDLGGSLVESDTRDIRRRQLRNVVEEIALASGVPVPEVYVLEQEQGINAFAAGYSPADAAVAVTRGALEKLNRDELQGVIAHEFSHILNGDMRINVRLMGALFGILLLALIGRRILIHSHFAGRSRDKNGAAILIIAFGLMAVGYVGQFFGRWIKAAVSRQREYLADASAVQFTRDPAGIGGALKKIAVYSDGSLMNAETEEVSHMLFGDGQKMLMFSTHPPLTERIRRIEPDFRDEDLERIRKKIQRDKQRRAERAERESRRQADSAGGILDAGNIIERIGQPDWEQILAAAALAASIAEPVRQAAHSTEWAPEVLFYSLLDDDSQVREQQLLIIATQMGHDSEQQVRALLEAGGAPRPEQRLPLMETAFPALKRRPPEFVTLVLDTVKALINADGRIEVFEYLLARVIAQHLWESQSPHTVKVAGAKSIAACRQQVLTVLSILARHGHEDVAGAQAAFDVGVHELPGGLQVEMPALPDWAAALDEALPVLDRLKSSEKEKLVRSMAAVVLHDGRLMATELELLRVICDLIHVPLPLLSGAQTT